MLHCLGYPFVDAVKTLLGEENGRRGTIKTFEVLQDVRLNKYLFYVSMNSCPFQENFDYVAKLISVNLHNHALRDII